MSGARIVVMGAGIAGLASALLLARRGFAVTVLERDQPPPEQLADIGSWLRPGAPQVRQLHTFLGLFRRHLRDHLPDVYDDLLASGAEDVSVAAPPGAGVPAGGDPDLAVLAARRPVVEWALHRALRRESSVDFRPRTSVRRAEVQRDRIRGVHVRGGMVEADVLIDTAGRRSPLLDEFTELEQEVDCGVVYNTRFYRLRDGVPRPGLSRGVTTMVAGNGFGAGLFYHDNRTFAIGLGRLPDDDALKALREPDAFDRVVGIFPEFEPWLRDADVLTEVVPMAGLRNSLRGRAADAPAGYLLLGDAMCTTDPAFGRGASVAMTQAVHLAETFANAGRRIGDLAAVGAEVSDHARRWVRPWFDDSVRADLGRTKLWEAAIGGAEIPPPAGPGTVNAFTLMAAGERDPVLWLAAQRHANLLDPADSLDAPELRDRLHTLWRNGWRPAQPTAPSYADVVNRIGDRS